MIIEALVDNCSNSVGNERHATRMSLRNEPEGKKRLRAKNANRMLQLLGGDKAKLS